MLLLKQLFTFIAQVELQNNFLKIPFTYLKLLIKILIENKIYILKKPIIESKIKLFQQSQKTEILSNYIQFSFSMLTI